MVETNFFFPLPVRKPILRQEKSFKKEQIDAELSLLNFQVLQKSREAVVDYMMPLGLHHIFAWGHHYGPEPWCDIPDARPDWLPPYYHRADNMGIGFDRSSTGSNATGQYHSPLCEQLDNVNTCPENLPFGFTMSLGIIR